ncbi:charged multivesicular body protein 2a [Artemisia annua]|uniref:Charged multivesicular body protein 2a n=1 Tax=Artemisia annua TaxID=35608 RepID=A0A2U1QL63_ARTAN|nr:charged multivesicular body protein 2a [Artemisia annua]
MNIPERNSNSYRNAYQLPPPHRRKTPSFSSSLLDSILRSIDETNEHVSQQQLHDRDHDHDMTFAYEPKVMSKINVKKSHAINEGVEQQMPSLRRAIMIDQWMETQNNNNNNSNNISYCNGNGQSTDCYISRKSTRKCSSDSISSGTTFTTSSATSEQTETPSTYRSLPNSFTISRNTAEAVFRDNTQKGDSKREGKFMKLTKLRAMKIYGDLKKVKQPISPGSRISAFLYSLFASSKKAKIEESIQNFRTLKKSRSIKQDTTMSCTSFSRSCMSKKQHSNGVKRSVRFYPETETVDVMGRKSSSERDQKFERRWFTEKKLLRENKRMIDKSIREIERERQGLQTQEKKLIVEIKKSAKQGQMGAVKIMAKDLIRTRHQIEKFYKLKSQLQGVSLRIQTLKSTQAMGEAMKGVTKAMGQMNRQMNLPSLQKIMREFEMQNEKMEMVLDEIGIDINQELMSAPSGAVSVPAGKTKVPQAEAPVTDDGGIDSDLQARLDNLRKM